MLTPKVERIIARMPEPELEDDWPLLQLLMNRQELPREQTPLDAARGQVVSDWMTEKAEEQLLPADQRRATDVVGGPELYYRPGQGPYDVMDYWVPLNAEVKELPAEPAAYEQEQRQRWEREVELLNHIRSVAVPAPPEQGRAVQLPPWLDFDPALYGR